MDQHHSIRAFYQNTVNYNTAPYVYISSFLPELRALENTNSHHLLDLWQYSMDEESEDEELDYLISHVSNIYCGISLDDHWINVSPVANWQGSCDATIQVSDTIDTAGDILRVTIVPIVAKVFLPVIMR